MNAVDWWWLEEYVFINVSVTLLALLGIFTYPYDDADRPAAH